MHENNLKVMEAAAKLKVNLVNISAEDLDAGTVIKSSYFVTHMHFSLRISFLDYFGN